MLEQWIYQGVVQDPYDEFQIKSRDELTKDNLRRDFNDTYWDERYTIRPDKLPLFLESVSEKILTTGKYLNVIRECGRTIITPQEVLQKIRYGEKERE
jgi:gamma-tubulin complex component 2